MMKLFVLSFLFHFLQSSEARDDFSLTRVAWTGTLAMFRVSKDKVTERINDYNSKFSCDGSKCSLYNVSYPIVLNWNQFIWKLHFTHRI